MKKTVITFGLALSFATSSNAALLISGISDGGESGGIPKSIELYTTTDIADLSAFWIARDTNGAGPWDTFQKLPGVPLAAGSYFYIAGDTASETYLNDAGFTVGLKNNIAYVNGDDIIGLATATTAGAVYDSVGVVAQGDTNFYRNSFAVRKNTSVTGDITSTDGANFTITGWDATTFAGTSGYGTYSPVPEPSSAALLGLGSLALVLRRRK